MCSSTGEFPHTALCLALVHICASERTWRSPLLSSGYEASLDATKKRHIQVGIKQAGGSDLAGGEGDSVPE